MPSMIVLNNCGEKDIHLLIKEEDFPMEGVQQVQNKVKSFISDNATYTREQLIEIAEEVIEDYYGTLIPFKLYRVSC